jgi:PST family polysaccharide transporter
LSSLHDDLAAMRRSYLRLTQASALLMCPSLVGLSLVAPEAIPLLFGSKWAGAVPFVQVIGLLGIVAPINYYFAPTMMALGNSRLVFRQGLLQVGLGMGLALIGALISLLAVAVANVLRGTIVAVWNLFELRNAMRLSLRDVAAHLAPPYLGTLAIAATVLVLRALIGAELPAMERLLVMSACGATAYAVVLTAGERLGLWPEHVGLRIPTLAARAVPAE